jgi:hypothetical protein
MPNSTASRSRTPARAGEAPSTAREVDRQEKQHPIQQGRVEKCGEEDDGRGAVAEEARRDDGGGGDGFVPNEKGQSGEADDQGGEDLGGGPGVLGAAVDEGVEDGDGRADEDEIADVVDAEQLLDGGLAAVVVYAEEEVDHHHGCAADLEG